MFLEPDTCRNAGLTISLGRDADTGEPRHASLDAAIRDRTPFAGTRGRTELGPPFRYAP